MPMYTARQRECGWMIVIDAPDARDALRQAKQLAPSASLLPSDITPACITRATEEDVIWYNMMCEPMALDPLCPPRKRRRPMGLDF